MEDEGAVDAFVVEGLEPPHFVGRLPENRVFSEGPREDQRVVLLRVRPSRDEERRGSRARDDGGERARKLRKVFRFESRPNLTPQRGRRDEPDDVQVGVFLDRRGIDGRSGRESRFGEFAPIGVARESFRAGQPERGRRTLARYDVGERGDRVLPLLARQVADDRDVEPRQRRAVERVGRDGDRVVPNDFGIRREEERLEFDRRLAAQRLAEIPIFLAREVVDQQDARYLARLVEGEGLRVVGELRFFRANRVRRVRTKRFRRKRRRVVLVDDREEP